MSTYKVEHTNGTSTVEGVHIIGWADHLLFFDTDEKVFAGFASGTWFSFAKVEAELLPGTVLSLADLDSAPTGFEVRDGADDQWLKGSNGLWTCYWDGVPGLVGTYSNWTSERLADYGVKVPGYKNPYAVGTVLTKEQFKAAPEGTKAETPEGCLFLRRENGTALVSYGGGQNRPDMYWHDTDIDVLYEADTDTFTVVTAP